MLSKNFFKNVLSKFSLEVGTKKRFHGLRGVMSTFWFERGNQSQKYLQPNRMQPPPPGCTARRNAKVNSNSQQNTPRRRFHGIHATTSRAAYQSPAFFSCDTSKSGVGIQWATQALRLPTMTLLSAFFTAEAFHLPPALSAMHIRYVL